jgi:hypothetical protein
VSALDSLQQDGFYVAVGTERLKAAAYADVVAAFREANAGAETDTDVSLDSPPLQKSPARSCTFPSALSRALMKWIGLQVRVEEGYCAARRGD